MKKAVILFSGGVDSVCVVSYLESKYDLSGISFSYGQKANREILAAKTFAKKLGLKQHKIIKRLRDLIQKIKPAGCGLIVRTASEGKGEAEILQDLDFLMKMWANIQKRKATSPVPSLVHKDLDITLRAIRDLFTQDVERVLVDSAEEYRKILDFCEYFMPQIRSSVEEYEKEEPLFDYYGIEMEVSRALGRKVWLKSGGYIVIEMTEALTVIDVNTGRYVGKRNLEDTILKTNLEAVRENRLPTPPAEYRRNHRSSISSWRSVSTASSPSSRRRSLPASG